MLLRRARVPVALLPPEFQASGADPLEPAVLCDIVVEGSRISAVALASAPLNEATMTGRDGAPLDGNSVGTPSSATGKAPSTASAGTEIDLEGALVFPGFVDAHVHLDKTHTWFRAPNRTGTFGEALTVLGRDREKWTEEDLLLRGDFAMRSAWAHGTRLIRTHVDTALPWAETSHRALAELRERWAGRIELQTVPLCGGADYAGGTAEALADLAIAYGASALGGFFVMDANLPRQLDCILSLARDRGVGIDLHVDENGNPQAEVLRHVAEAVLRNSFPHTVVCGHCCSLAAQGPERQRSTIALVKESGIGVISLPLCNLYLQDRRGASFPRTPSWRGMTLIHDLLDANVPVACASDNVRDAFHAFGDYDMAEVYGQSVRLAHLDERLADSVRVVTSTSADLLGRPEFGRVKPGAPAHLVVFEARSFSEFLSRPSPSRRCIDGESIRAIAPPDYRELASIR
jgi:cytosine deaminase